MLNYLYPDAIDNFIRMQIKGLRQPTAQALFNVLKLWVKEQNDNGRELDCLPEGSPDWAYKRLSESAIYEFIPSKKTIEKVNNLVSFIKEIELIAKNSKNPTGKQFSTKLLRKLKNETVSSLVTKRAKWIENPKRPNILAELNCNSNLIPTINEHYWIECQSLEQMHRFGKELGKNCCLSQGYYDNDFIDRYLNGLQIFGLFDNCHNLVAVASFYNGSMDDVEAKGTDRTSRQNAVINYQPELLDLINHESLQISEDNSIIIERTQICVRSDISVPDIDQSNFKFWFDNSNDSLIIKHKKHHEYCYVDFDSITPTEHSNFNLYSLKETTSCKSPFDHSPKLFHSLCTAFEKAYYNNEIELDFLTQFHEFTNTGDYWLNVCNNSDNSCKTKIGTICKYNDQFWWHDKYTDNVYLWYDNNRYPNSDSVVLEIIRKRVNQKYKAAGHFWGSLAQLSIFSPDLVANKYGELSLSHSSYNKQLISKTDNWNYVKSVNNGEYVILSRQVDDNACQETEQWICKNRDHGPIAGILVRKVSDRKRIFHIQVPGRDPKGYALLYKSLNVNQFSKFFVEHSNYAFGKPIEKLFFKRDNLPITPTESYDGINLSTTVYNNHLYIFDGNNQISIIIKLNKEKSIVDAKVFSNPDDIRSEFYAIISRIGITLNDKLNNIAKLFGYYVIDGKLNNLPDEPEISEENIQAKFCTNKVEIIYEDEYTYAEIMINDKGNTLLWGEISYDDISFKPIQNSILIATEYYGVKLSKRIEKAFNIDLTPTGYRASKTTPPLGWSCKGEDTFDEQDGIIYWVLDDDINEPVIRIDGDNINCNCHQYHQLFKHQNKIQEFLDWYYD